MYAHDHEPIADLLSAINSWQPTALIGASGMPNAFNSGRNAEVLVIDEASMLSVPQML